MKVAQLIAEIDRRYAIDKSVHLLSLLDWIDKQLDLTHRKKYDRNYYQTHKEQKERARKKRVLAKFQKELEAAKKSKRIPAPEPSSPSPSQPLDQQ